MQIFETYITIALASFWIISFKSSLRTTTALILLHYFIWKFYPEQHIALKSTHLDSFRQPSLASSPPPPTTHHPPPSGRPFPHFLEPMWTNLLLLLYQVCYLWRVVLHDLHAATQHIQTLSHRRRKLQLWSSPLNNDFENRRTCYSKRKDAWKSLSLTPTLRVCSELQNLQ